MLQSDTDSSGTELDTTTITTTTTSFFDCLLPYQEPIGMGDKEDGYKTPAAVSTQNSEYTLATPLSKRVDQLRNGSPERKTPALKVPASPLMQRLGYGTGVGVYLLERSPNKTGEIQSPWAIKKLIKLKEASEIYSERLEYETKILKELNHPNIIGYRGCSVTISLTSVLAMEKASAALSDLIEDRMTEMINSNHPTCINPMPSKTIELITLHIARALDYLHEEKKMIHGDVKSGNILIFGDIEIAKLCDFGVARKLKKDGTIDGHYVGTELWNPMEVILEHNGTPNQGITTKADIYPLGLTIYEMLALKPPHISLEPNEETEDSDADATSSESTYEDRLTAVLGTRPALPEFDFDDSYNRILEVFYVCTTEDPDDRPSAEDLVVDLTVEQNYCRSIVIIMHWW